MPQYGSFRYNELSRTDIPYPIPIDVNIKEALSAFFLDCECAVRVEEGISFHLINGEVIQVNVMDLTDVVIQSDYIGFSLQIEKPRDVYTEKNIMIPFSSILYMEVLPFNEETYRMG